MKIQDKIKQSKQKSDLEFPQKTAPNPAELKEVAEGIFWIRMPLPFALNHVNLWLMEDNDGWCLVDTGFGDETTRKIWKQLFKTGLMGRKISRLLVTHFHPDHIGLAGWLNEQIPNLGLTTTRTEWLQARLLGLDTSSQFDREHVDFYRRAGADIAFLDAIHQRGNIYQRRVTPIPASFTRIVEGDIISIGKRKWNVITGTGHSPEHVCLFCPDDSILIAGDQVLPEISPNVSIWPIEPCSDPLTDFIDTLRRFTACLPKDTYVLPSHGKPFLGLHTRIKDLIAHHEERLNLAEEALLNGGSTIFDVTSALFKRDLDMHQRIFAIGESLSHLNRLVTLGRINQQLDRDGVLRFYKS